MKVQSVLIQTISSKLAKVFLFSSSQVCPSRCFLYFFFVVCLEFRTTQITIIHNKNFSIFFHTFRVILSPSRSAFSLSISGEADYCWWEKNTKNVQKIYRPLKIGWRSRVPVENTQPPRISTDRILIRVNSLSASMVVLVSTHDDWCQN